MTVGGCREVNSAVEVVDTVVVVSAVVITSAELAKPPKALSTGSACSLGYPRVVTPTRGESADPNIPRPPTEGWSPAGLIGVGGRGPGRLCRHRLRLSRERIV